MRRLYRQTPDTRQVSVENRVDSLERRYVTVPTNWAVASFSVTPQSVGSGGTLLTWENFRSTTTRLSTSSIGGATNNAPGDVAIRLEGAGIVLVTVNVVFESGTFYRKVVVNGGGGETDAISNLADITSGDSWADETEHTGGETFSENDQQWFQNGDDGFNGWFTAQANVGAAQPSKNAVSASLTVVLFQASGVLWDDTEVY